MAAVLLIALAVAGCHSVTTSPAPQLPSVPPVQRSAANAPPPAGTFVVTIDDGYRDGLTNALPIIRGLGLVATFYVVTGRLGEPSELRPGDLQTLADAGMEIGDHTVRHVNLAHLSGPE